ncbi:alpha/beta hydrolase [Streptomyces pseudovenezuelae]|uniref:alpha/beta hydrolase n=1 Tax=Streptomyces pseudovenezuelae TaxID=67350 RepID=UPI002E35CA71|nr:alpha/beta hydrolase [Streptomyces pseudovenezuelae]
MSTEVSFTSNNLRIAGLFFTPEGHAGERLPAVVIGHPGGGVKEQTASIYAQRLADKGYAALVFDAAYQGESEGLPRGLEDPYQRSEDVKAAVSYLTTRADVDPERIGALGICASGGYVPFAAQTDTRIKAVSTVSAFDAGDAVRGGMDGQQGPEGLQQILDLSASMRTAEAGGAEPAYAPIVPESFEEGGEGYEYYRTPRGQHPRSDNKQLIRSLDRLVQFDAFRFMSMIAPRPVLMIAGTEAFSRPYSEKAVSQTPASSELFLVEGATHMSLYDQDEHVTPAVDKLDAFYSKALAA